MRRLTHWPAMPPGEARGRILAALTAADGVVAAAARALDLSLSQTWRYIRELSLVEDLQWIRRQAGVSAREKPRRLGVYT